VEIKVKFADGTVREIGSVESILRGGHTICTPDLDNKLKNVVCPQHGTMLSGMTIEWKQQMMLTHYFGSCTTDCVCDKLKKLAERILDQDQERGMEFYGSGRSIAHCILVFG